MFSKVLVKYTGIFLILRLYISATLASATPIEQPGEAHNITDIDARAFGSTDDGLPYQCEDPYTWIRRECLPGSLSGWQDVCTRDVYYPVLQRYQTVNDNKIGYCDPGYHCYNIIKLTGDRFVLCLPNVLGTEKGRFDPQAGKSDPKRAHVELGTHNTQFDYSVKLDHDMTGASVTADIESEDGTFLIAPNNVIVGNVHGRVQEVCHGDKSNPASARNCYPKGKYDFTAGQTIDFTWGMTNDQVGILSYSIIPAR